MLPCAFLVSEMLTLNQFHFYKQYLACGEGAELGPGVRTVPASPSPCSCCVCLLSLVPPQVLDPEQNHNFTDHYLNVAFDLSQVLFIATANTTATIPPALLDRMEIIQVPGTGPPDKVTVRRFFLSDLRPWRAVVLRSSE